MFRARHLLRRKTIVFVVLSLLVSQSALASYLCPTQSQPHAMAQTMAAGAPCEGMDEAQPALCHQHAADPGQVVQAAQVLSPSLPAVIQVLIVPVALCKNEAAAMPRACTPETQPPPDPLFLSTLRLRV